MKNVYYTASIIVAIIALFSLGCKVGESTIKAELNVLKNRLQYANMVDSIDIPEMINNLNTVSVDLNKFFVKIENLTYLSRRNDSLYNALANYADSVSKLNDKLRFLIVDNNTLIEQAKILERNLLLTISETESFRLRCGQSKQLANNLITVGLESVQDNQISINVNNRECTLGIGNNLEIIQNGVRGILTLTEINHRENINSNCRLRFSEIEIQSN